MKRQQNMGIVSRVSASGRNKNIEFLAWNGTQTAQTTRNEPSITEFAQYQPNK